MTDDLFSELRLEIERSPLNAQTIAHLAGCSPSTIYLWLRRKVAAPRIKTLEAVARALGKRLMIEDGVFVFEPLQQTATPARRERFRSNHQWRKVLYRWS